MHEMSMALSLVGLVEERARAEGAARVLRVGVTIGRLGPVEPEALAFCLQSAVRGTLLEGAAFDYATPPGVAYCFNCGTETEVAARGDPCAHCGGHALQIAAGEQLTVTHMEIT